jgi:hypothetical protein
MYPHLASKTQSRKKEFDIDITSPVSILNLMSIGISDISYPNRIVTNQPTVALTGLRPPLANIVEREIQNTPNCLVTADISSYLILCYFIPEFKNCHVATFVYILANVFYLLH